MSAADPNPLDALSDQNRAILSLLLVRGRGYQEIAELLKLDSTRVRDRAHAAIEALAPGQTPRPDAAARARIADYLVGEQSVSERARTRTQLAGSEPERAWATGVAQALAPLAGEALPSIPDPTPDPDPTLDLNLDPHPNLDPEPDPHQDPAQEDPAPDQDPDPDPHLAPESDPDTPRRDPEVRTTRGTLTALGLLAAVVAAVILVIVLSGSHSRTASTEQTIERLTLRPVGTDRAASGTGAVVRPAHEGLMLFLRGRGLPANRDNSYAVWLSNRPGSSLLLGFISPDVGAAGTFSSSTALPADADRFHELIVTLETTSRPVSPGRAVLETQLKLP